MVCIIILHFWYCYMLSSLFHDNYAVIISLRVIQCRLLLIINLKKYRIVQFIDRGKSDGLALPRYLLGSI